MALHHDYHALAREYVGLLMTDKSARDEHETFVDHDTDAQAYHEQLRDFVNRRLKPQKPLPREAAHDFHKHVSDNLEEFRQNIRRHTAGEREYILACDGYGGKNCPL